MVVHETVEHVSITYMLRVEYFRKTVTTNITGANKAANVIDTLIKESRHHNEKFMLMK